MKVVIIGLGSIAKKHIEAINVIESENQIYALRHSKESLPVDGIIDFYDIELIKEINPSFVIVSNLTSEHFKTLKKLLEFNYPLFIEKPLFSGVGEKEKELVRAINDKKIKTYVACNLRFHEGIRFLKKELKDKKVEEVNVYCGSYLPDWRPGKDFRKIYSANKEMGGGVHIDLIHELDYLYWIFKEPKSIVKTFSSKSSLNISSVDYANFIWEYETFYANIILNYYRKEPKRTFEVLTHQGTYLLDLLSNKIMFNNSTIFESKQGLKDMYIDQMNFFTHHVIKGEKFNTIRESYKVLELCLKD
ncbi:Gfo/Idh/MocA family protein [Tenacibaculum jejuense]|uniref:Oxidoreductase n=1 Tax=Tenacibaculum jejuense TaxID=584609 RepID=A0A238U6W7_9FLAO|nr:Gfo/Idh/MocA family oxidoreductase [Tenacibaculum jejuense]SNR14897.1 Oxidoreductase [Tenacibaculum jejuense]